MKFGVEQMVLFFFRFGDPRCYAFFFPPCSCVENCQTPFPGQQIRCLVLRRVRLLFCSVVLRRKLRLCSRESNGLDISQECQYTTQLNVHTTQDSVAAKLEDNPGRPGLTESKRHYLCITSLLPRHSDMQQTNDSFFPRRPKWYKR